MIRTALYVRVSGPGQDLETQKADLRRYCETQGWPVTEVFEESVSGTGIKVRPEFERLLSLIRQGAVDIVLVTKLDRLARSVRDAIAFFAEAEERRVRVVVTTQAIDTDTPVGRLTRTILAGIAEFEAELIRDRTRAAMAAIKAGTKPTRTGRMPGRPRRVTPEAIERARDLWRTNHSWAEIAQAVGLKAETIRRAVWAARPRTGGVGNTGTGERPDSSGGDRAGG
jgi:DNA invertase Pin-like site-specific DNA recombinase